MYEDPCVATDLDAGHGHRRVAERTHRNVVEAARPVRTLQVERRTLVGRAVEIDLPAGLAVDQHFDDRRPAA